MLEVELIFTNNVAYPETTCSKPSRTLARTVIYSNPHIVVESTATFSCSSGYILNGTAIVTCQESGYWSDPVPTCVGKTKP